ncbi:L-serine ammonia-lyase, iron-sulfur-dependent, subunit alpha [Garciella nitratireducens]|uniref:L-serine ammonia-lyase, iron-sulfur-dependent, subunit alpha n=1 Tax=Garciella nitratireducens TaxID=218205 RepID=UPI000DE81763|nr:L-serine ammonia-lyase, iron-sulfur-dependent, subunit alpha [Garciella nitratireducens]RBP42223.1 L-serine dehydratase [Garciella nitratireducens]
MYHSAKQLLELCEQQKKTIYQVVIEEECKTSGSTPEKIYSQMKEVLEVMEKSSQDGLNKKISSLSGMIGGDAKRVYEYQKKAKTLLGAIPNQAMAMAFSTSEINASMGKIVAAPTAGASGILPAVLMSLKEHLRLKEEDLIHALLVAVGIGQIIGQNATFAGAEGGCQVECGSAASMAAAAAVFAAGGNNEQILHGASIALINIMGLVCDPIAGLVEFPCALRNASGTLNALSSADLALAGVQSVIPFDEVVDAMYKVGKALPETLRETGLGGVAATETGCSIRKNLFKEGE